eukprot:CAMPEP_0181415238 /NCGR_PEP_ID=MMETSP1110-20121109/9914_1 /TAXON_ID=174948 /ORGANISM="Symbiodinium sp., Strain CCMP421" /LENGTH=51 /DNA_ID=CAMNT_0023538135 /DNA_START=881 /DNA_END=1036 /DNA_ORIENTATION=+
MEAVTCPMTEEKTINAKKSTKIENARSPEFRAVTSMDAGVNWVRLQCKDVV